MKNTILICILFTFAIAGTSDAQTSFNGKPRYEILVKRADTMMGKITVEMFPAIAPNHVRNWDSLVTIHFFDSTAFHRVIPGYVIQGGDPNSRSGPRDTWGYGDPEQQTIDAEFSSVSHRRGILSAARVSGDINSATSQFFICIAAQTQLDRQYSVYGKVTAGMDIADSIVKAPCDAGDNPFDKISMFITRTGTNDSATATPRLVSPRNDSNMIAMPKVTFRWNKISDAMMYTLQVAADSAFTNMKADSNLRQTDTSAAIGKLTSGMTYYWRVRANNGGKISDYSPVWNFYMGSLSVRGEKKAEVELRDAYPNPAEGNAAIGFYLGEASEVRLTLTDILGRDVRTLIDSKFLPAGEHEAEVAHTMLTRGIYIYRLEAGGKTLTKRLVFH